MQVLSLVWKEIRYRWISSLLSCAGIALAVAACLAILAMHESAERETRRVQRDIGFNLRIIPQETDVEEFLLRGYASETMPEEVVQRLAAHKTVAYNHLVATLQDEIAVGGKPAILTGLSPTFFPPGQKKPPMSPTIKPGTAHLGHRIAARLDVQQGGSLDLQGEPFEVVRVAPEAGTSDDIRVWVNLQDAQRLLDKEGQVNEIRAIDCLCLVDGKAPQEILRQEIGQVAPEAQVAMATQIASARARQRQIMERLIQTAIPALVVVAALLVGILAFINVRQRRQEIGILRAVGHRSGTIAALILTKAFALGLAGAAAGSLIGTYFALTYIPQISMITGAKYRPETNWFVAALVLAPVVACVASFIPASLAVSQHPADVLREP